MKKLLSLIVAMVFCLGVMAEEKPDLKGQAVLNTAIAVQLGGANTVAIDQTETDLSQASALQVGLHNVGYIEQIGLGNDAGVMAMPMLPNVCVSSYTSLFDVAYQPTITNVGMSFNLICGEPVVVGDIVAELPVFRTGLIQMGAFNLGSIYQEGVKNKAGVMQLGLANQAGLQQFGKKNKAAINQIGSFNASVVSQDGEKNIALVAVSGALNRTVVDQDGKENKAVQIVDGLANTAIVDQLGCSNTAIQAVEGAFNFVLANQKGFYNRAVQTTQGVGNISEVFQVGACNSAFIEQGIPESVEWSGIQAKVMELERDDYLGYAERIKQVKIAAPTCPCNPHD